MRLQSAIFTLPDALLDGGALRPGADKVLSHLGVCQPASVFQLFHAGTSVLRLSAGSLAAPPGAYEPGGAREKELQITVRLSGQPYR